VWLAALVGLIPALPILAGFVITANGGGARSAGTGAYKPFLPTAPRGSATTVNAGMTVAVVEHATTMRATPGGVILGRLGLRTEFGSPEALWVVRRSGQWLGVVSPLAGNGRVGWIPRAAASLTPIGWQLEISLSRRQLTVSLDGQVQRRYTVAIGRPEAPTPTGRFAVTDRLTTNDSSGPYGCCILALSAHSPHAIQGWGGGDRIAIHSTTDLSSIGQPVSHGCLRLTLSEGRWLLNHVPLGTPALISN
jgi:hypothetical protein